MSFQVTNVPSATVQTQALEPEAQSKAEAAIKELNLVDNNDGTFSRDGYNGSYAIQDDGSVYYSGHDSTHTAATSQIYKDGQWSTANAEETAQGNASLLGLDDKGNGYFSDGKNDYKAMDNGALYHIADKENLDMAGLVDPKGAIYEQGEFRDASDSEFEEMRLTVAEESRSNVIEYTQTQEFMKLYEQGQELFS